MYWLSVSTISVLIYFYCRGKKHLAAQPADRSATDHPSPAPPPSESRENDPNSGVETETNKKTAAEQNSTSPVAQDHATDQNEKNNVSATGNSEGGGDGAVEEPFSRVQTKTADGKAMASPPESDVPTDILESYETIQAMASLTETADPWQWHTTYTRGIEDAYKNRTKDPRMMDIVVLFGKRYVSRFPLIKESVLAHLGDRPRAVSVFKHLVIVLDEAEAFDEAIGVCNTAVSHDIVDGTRTGFQGRIERISHRKETAASTGDGL